MKQIAIMASLFAAGLTACNKWEDHNELADAALGKTLVEEIGSRTNLSTFASLLKQSGLDKEISPSKVYTIWAPSNEALASLNPAITGDSAKLRAFLVNCIANEAYYTKADSVRVAMLNGKRIWVVGSKFDDATITTANVKTGNGVLQVVDKAILPLQNAWDFVTSTTAQYKQNNFIAALNYKVQDLTNAVVDSISSTTGKPIYKPGTDSVMKNQFRTAVVDLQDESKQFTYFIIKDDALQLEVDSLKTYFVYASGSTTAQESSSTWTVVRDLAVEGLYTLDKLPEQIKTKYGVLPIVKSAIAETHRVSNGIVYVFDKIDFRKEDKIQPIILQGENFSVASNKRTVTFYRVRNDSLGKQFQDVAINGHSVTDFAISSGAYLNSVKYNISWVAYNDFYYTNQTINGATVSVLTPFTQRIGVNTATNLVGTLSVGTGFYKEQAVSSFTQATYGYIPIYLVANGTTPLTLDYVKLTPVFQ